MLYRAFSAKIKNLVLEQEEDSKVWYLDPDWKDKLHRNGLGNLEKLEDSYITDWSDVEDILKLEVERRNAIDGRKHVVINWLYDIIKQKAEPIEAETEAEMVRNLLSWQHQNIEPTDE